MIASEGHALYRNPTVVPVVMGRSWWGSSDRLEFQEQWFRSQGPRTGCCRPMRPWAGHLSEERLWGHCYCTTAPGHSSGLFCPRSMALLMMSVVSLFMWLFLRPVLRPHLLPSSGQQPHLLPSLALWGLYLHIYFYQSSLLNLLGPTPAFPSSKPTRPFGKC